MKFKQFQLTFAACAAAALVASCGGSDDAPAAAAPAAAEPTGVVITGTAATGLALASAPVSVKCATGAGTATTDATGTYSVTIGDGALPCLIQVTGTVNGNTIALHSVADAGTAGGGTTTARANVTPFTELIVASLLGQVPSAAFQAFTGTGVTAAQVTAAATRIVAAIKEATGVDLGSIDPLKATLVAATLSAPNAGNDYDKALDALRAKISAESFPLMAAQIANNPTGGASALAQSLSFAPGCPSAISGRYRTVGLTGEVATGTLDFKNMLITFDGHTVSPAIRQNPNQPCDFSLNGTAFAEDAGYRFAIGTQGAGAYRESGDVTGYLFPVQASAASASAGAGAWLFSQTGIVTDETPQRVNWMSKLTFGTDGSVTACDYDNGANWTGACTTDSQPFVATVVAGTNGSLELREAGTAVARFWTFRSPSGATTLYGTTRVSDTTTTTEMTSFVASRQTTLALPVVGTVTRSMGFTTSGVANTANGLTTALPTSAVFAVDSVNAAAGTFVRSGTNAGTPITGQVVTLNSPQSGLRTTAATNIQMLVPGTGLTLSLRPTTLTSGFSHTINVGLATPASVSASATPAPSAQ